MVVDVRAIPRLDGCQKGVQLCGVQPELLNQTELADEVVAHDEERSSVAHLVQLKHVEVPLPEVLVEEAPSSPGDGVVVKGGILRRLGLGRRQLREVELDGKLHPGGIGAALELVRGPHERRVTGERGTPPAGVSRFLLFVPRRPRRVQRHVVHVRGAASGRGGGAATAALRPGWSTTSTRVRLVVLVFVLRHPSLREEPRLHLGVHAAAALRELLAQILRGARARRGYDFYDKVNLVREPGNARLGAELVEDGEHFLHGGVEVEVRHRGFAAVELLLQRLDILRELLLLLTNLALAQKRHSHVVLDAVEDKGGHKHGEAKVSVKVILDRALRVERRRVIRPDKVDVRRHLDDHDGRKQQVEQDDAHVHHQRQQDDEPNHFLIARSEAARIVRLVVRVQEAHVGLHHGENHNNKGIPHLKRRKAATPHSRVQPRGVAPSDREVQRQTDEEREQHPNPVAEEEA
mmetsp:Transcript_26868/g.88157  ORF Transcript_26868/g.88157 Transcript_26868/m.88157 type:complete len:463 (-) Transcript_26868:448-1836(-)